jgi:hypothetical protein
MHTITSSTVNTKAALLTGDPTNSEVHSASYEKTMTSSTVNAKAALLTGDPT